MNGSLNVRLFIAVNPLAFLLDAYRQVLMSGVAPDVPHLFLLGMCFGLIAVAGVYLLRTLSQTLALKSLTA